MKSLFWREFPLGTRCSPRQEKRRLSTLRARRDTHLPARQEPLRLLRRPASRQPHPGEQRNRTQRNRSQRKGRDGGPVSLLPTRVHAHEESQHGRVRLLPRPQSVSLMQTRTPGSVSAAKGNSPSAAPSTKPSTGVVDSQQTASSSSSAAETNTKTSPTSSCSTSAPLPTPRPNTSLSAGGGSSSSKGPSRGSTRTSCSPGEKSSSSAESLTPSTSHTTTSGR